MGDLEVKDQIEAARYVGSLSYVDASRIGIYGWSYGGFMALGCILKGNDVFKMAISVAPVTSWRYYDTIYTELYNGLPQENPDHYTFMVQAYNVPELLKKPIPIGMYDIMEAAESKALPSQFVMQQ